MTQPQSVCILGSTGSIGVNTLDVIARHTDRYSVYALTANKNVALMLAQCVQFHPSKVVMQDEQAAEQLRVQLNVKGLNIDVEQGASALAELAASEPVNIVVAAIVGAAGLLSTLAAAEAGKRILLANKEALVMSGQLLMQRAAKYGATIMPVDSEHNAIFQSLPATNSGVSFAGVENIVLTGSGGPLRKCSVEELSVVTPQQALKHPNWSMGRKISIDSATLMNKGLELIEACTLFDLPLEKVEVLIHPESVIHSMVRYSDGSVIAQLGQPDMRTPIAHALAWPERISSGVEPLDFKQLNGLHFEEPDTQRFPCLRLATEAQAVGGTAPTVLNAANEMAVDAFLNGFVSFLQLAQTVEYALTEAKISPASDLTTIIEADTIARQLAQNKIDTFRNKLS